MPQPLSQAEAVRTFVHIQKPSQVMSLGLRLALRLMLIPAGGAVILFGSAGTSLYWQGWVFLAAAALPAIFVISQLARRDPEMTERRLRSGEKVKAQRTLARWAKPIILAAFFVPGLDFRLGWSRTLVGSVPLWLTVLADVLVLVSVLFVGWVVNINRFASRTIRVVRGQTVISEGPYCLVRHPMYAGSLMLWLAMPLALGSWVAWPAFALLIPFYVLRLLNEEKVLTLQLNGYAAYCKRTPFRLLPWVW